MIVYSHHYFNLLKDCVLAKAEIKHLIPSECQILSNLIFLETKKRVSETTLKRIYGFAVSKFKPSPFTMQTLAEYCGYESWEDFCNQEQQLENKPAEKISWKSLCIRTNRISQFTLQSLKKRSGIPYHLTIKRKFVQQHFDAFKQSQQAATLFSAHTGYGKTISLCHLVDNLLQQNPDDQCTDNMVLFFSTNSITNVSSNELNLGEWFLSFLGLQSGNNLLELFEEKANQASNFYLIIDGFDEHMFKTEQFLFFFNSLIDVISYYSKFSWFKVILSMRSSTWLNFRYLIESKPQLWEKWHTGFMHDELQTNNFIPFSTDEILELSHAINPASELTPLPSPEVIKKLSYPLFFQLYYQKNTQNFTIAQPDELYFYDIISLFAANKIYHGTNSMEKVLLIKNLLEKIDYQSNTFSIPKIVFCDYIKSYNSTYKELISNDILREENFSKYLQYQEQISFGNIALLEYCLARKLFGWNDEKLDENLIVQVETLLGQSTIKVAVLKWMLFFIINNNNFDQISYFKDINLQPSERLEIIVSTCQFLQNKIKETKDQEQLKSYFQQIEHDETFSFFLSLQYLSPEYEKALYTLLNFDLNNQNKILIYTTLAVMYILNMNADKAENCINRINCFPPEYLDEFVVNPLNCLNTIFCYFKFGIIQKEALQQITHLCYHDSAIKKLTALEYNYQEIILKLAFLTLRINNNPHKELRFIGKIIKQLEPDYSKSTSQLYGFFLNIQANAYVRLGKTKSAYRIQNKVLNFYQEDETLFTPFMKTLFNLLTVRHSAQNQADKVMLLQVKSLMAYCRKYNFKFAEVYSGIIYLTSPQAENANTEDLADIYQIILKHIRISSFRLESFINPFVQAKVEQFLQKNNNVA